MEGACSSNPPINSYSPQVEDPRELLDTSIKRQKWNTAWRLSKRDLFLLAPSPPRAKFYKIFWQIVQFTFLSSYFLHLWGKEPAFRKHWGVFGGGGFSFFTAPRGKHKGFTKIGKIKSAKLCANASRLRGGFCRWPCCGRPAKDGNRLVGKKEWDALKKKPSFLNTAA